MDTVFGGRETGCGSHSRPCLCAITAPHSLSPTYGCSGCAGQILAPSPLRVLQGQCWGGRIPSNRATGQGRALHAWHPSLHRPAAVLVQDTMWPARKLSLRLEVIPPTPGPFLICTVERLGLPSFLNPQSSRPHPSFLLLLFQGLSPGGQGCK